MEMIENCNFSSIFYFYFVSVYELNEKYIFIYIMVICKAIWVHINQMLKTKYFISK